MIFYLAVGMGGALGAISRIALGKLLPADIMGLPTQILCINVFGCFLMGCLTAFLAVHNSVSNNMRSFLTAGCLGGFTTFSAFTFEFEILCEKHLYVSALLYSALSFILSISLFFIGIKIFRIFY